MPTKTKPLIESCPEGARPTVVRGLPTDAEVIDELGDDDRIKWADRHGTRRETERYRKMRSTVTELLKGTIWEVGPSIGRGRYSTVYELRHDKTKVLKLTGDPSDAVTWSRVLQLLEQGSIRREQVNSLANVSCVLRVPIERSPRDMFLILCDRYKPMPSAPMAFLDALTGILEFGWPDARTMREVAVRTWGEGWMRGKTLKQIESQVSKWLEKRGLRRLSEADIVLDPRNLRGLFDAMIDVWEEDLPDCGAHADRILETLMTLMRHGLYPRDLHSEQVMVDRRGGSDRWKIVDLGVTTMIDPKQQVATFDAAKLARAP